MKEIIESIFRLLLALVLIFFSPFTNTAVWIWDRLTRDEQ